MPTAFACKILKNILQINIALLLMRVQIRAPAGFERIYDVFYLNITYYLLLINRLKKLRKRRRSVRRKRSDVRRG